MNQNQEIRKYGQLLTPDIRIHRQYFREMVKLMGIHVLYRAPLEKKMDNKFSVEKDSVPTVHRVVNSEGKLVEKEYKANPHYTGRNPEDKDKVHIYDKYYSMYGELDGRYEKPILVGCIFDQHPTQQTLKKIGWMSELGDNSSIIHVDYDLPGLQQGALFIVPSGLDDGKGRLFRVVKMSTDMIYPASVTCEIVPEYIDSFSDLTGMEVEELSQTENLDFLQEEDSRFFSDEYQETDFPVRW